MSDTKKLSENDRRNCFGGNTPASGGSGLGLADHGAVCWNRSAIYDSSAGLAVPQAGHCPPADPHPGKRQRHHALRCPVHGPGCDHRHGEYRRRGHCTQRRRSRRAVLDARRRLLRYGNSVCRGLSGGEIPSPRQKRLAGRTLLLYRAGAWQKIPLAGGVLCCHRCGGGDLGRGHCHPGQQHYLCGGWLFLLRSGLFRRRPQLFLGDGPQRRAGDSSRGGGAFRRRETHFQGLRVPGTPHVRGLSALLRRGVDLLR